jgi:uncharacterized protein (DUF1697 family)
VTVRVALLRGINLGSHKKVAMADLRDLAETIGLTKPKTYVQSGNLVFETGLAERATVSALEKGLEDRFGFEVPVICRSGAEIEGIAREHPFSGLGLDDRFLHVAFLDRSPDGDAAELIDVAAYSPDRLVGEGREVYLAYPGGLGRSKLNHGLLEKRLGVAATIRNWRTVTKLAAMVAERS